MRKKADIHIMVMRLAAVLLSLVMLTTGIVSGRYARYVTGATGSDSARVAKFKVNQSILYQEENLSQSATVPMPDILPGGSRSVFVEVAHDTETAVKNTFKVDSTGNLPLTFRVSEKNTRAAMGGEEEFTYTPGTFTVQYDVTITWPDTANAQAYIGMVDLLTITVTTEQID